jgi:prolactin releasing hormone receptor
MANNSTHFFAIPSDVLLFSVVFKFVAMIIGILGNMTVIIYAIFTNKEKTATSYLVGNLALADLLVCLTFYPIWIIEFILTILNIDSDQDLFCKLSRSTIWSLLFASVNTLLAIIIDRYLYIVKPLKYPLIVTKRRVFLAISGIWLTTCCLFVLSLVHWRMSDFRLRSLCDINEYIHRSIEILVGYLPLTLILILNIRILIVAEKQRKRILAETAVPAITTSDRQPGNKISAIRGFFRAVKAVKTFSIVVAVLAFCVLTPTVLGTVIQYSNCSPSCLQMWYVVCNYQLYGINSIVNAFIYGMRHIKYRKAYRFILFKILRCNQPGN